MRLRLTFFTYIVLTFLILCVVLVNTMSYNALSRQLDAKRAVFSIFPQGWAFFTRNPREGQAILYRIENDNSFNHANYKHNDTRFMFGLNRTCTKVFTELGYIRKDIPDSLFTMVKWNYQNDRANEIDLTTIKSVTITPPLKNNILSGRYLLIIQEPIPWAWSANLKTIKMPALSVILNIKK